MDKDMQDVLEMVTKRNPGAIRVFFELLEYLQEFAVVDFGILVARDITGSEVWDLYKCCKHDIAAFHENVEKGTAIKQLQSVPGSKFYRGDE